MVNQTRTATGMFVTVPILEVLNNFMINIFITKSSDFKSVLVNGQTSKRYSRTGKYSLLTSCSTTFPEDTRPTLPKIALTARYTFSMMQ